ncbi:hypothetical protein [Mycobacterium sp. Aquia_213]|uniref:hypothetical protein n=1 Tax=Mycobacterium sp. Aquia_213 TaxID=2991728 RepID=UPI0022714DC1|nr:hypothetical protein [Mycobacterium sp. Aquia_213]WAC90260.1 hypothetical protein LMQ14_20350 [Mycobacterium sp. Aquia_213]
MPFDDASASRVSAAEHADSLVAAARSDPAARLALLRRLYEVPHGVDRGYLPYRRAASAFMGWQLRRGLLNPQDDACPGSPWWRAVNETLLRDTAEARAFAFGHPGEPTSPAVGTHLDFIRQPTARNWYRAHNASIAAAYLANEALARQETRVERFFINVVLIRVLYAHALVAAPRLALGWLAPFGRPLGDPRLGMTGIFLSLSRILPDRYPLGDDAETYIALEHGFGHLLDVGVIQPRWGRLYEWSSDELGRPGLRDLLAGNTPAYAWDSEDAEIWQFTPSRLARAARRVIPA